MVADATSDEITVFVAARSYHFHLCILIEGKFWKTNREHIIGACSIILTLTENINFTVLKHCLKCHNLGTKCQWSYFQISSCQPARLFQTEYARFQVIENFKNQFKILTVYKF